MQKFEWGYFYISVLHSKRRVKQLVIDKVKPKRYVYGTSSFHVLLQPSYNTNYKKAVLLVDVHIRKMSPIVWKRLGASPDMCSIGWDLVFQWIRAIVVCLIMRESTAYF